MNSLPVSRITEAIAALQAIHVVHGDLPMLNLEGGPFQFTTTIWSPEDRRAAGGDLQDGVSIEGVEVVRESPAYRARYALRKGKIVVNVPPEGTVMVNESVFSSKAETLYHLATSIRSLGHQVERIFDNIPEAITEDLGGERFERRFHDINSACHCLGELADYIGGKIQRWSIAAAECKLHILRPEKRATP